MAEILQAVQANLQLSHLLVVLVGTVAGTVIGALPGLSAVSGVALLLPFTFSMEPAQGLIMLAAVYMSAEYGGSISAILINTPGTSGAACTTLDGTPLTRQGRAQEALYTSLFAGTVGGLIGALVLVFFTPLAGARLAASGASGDLLDRGGGARARRHARRPACGQGPGGRADRHRADPGRAGRDLGRHAVHVRRLASGRWHSAHPDPARPVRGREHPGPCSRRSASRWPPSSCARAR